MTDSRQRPCRHHGTPVGCRYGDRCQFSHDAITGHRASYQGRAPSAVRSMPCRFYGTPRGCAKGANCTFLHGQEPAAAATMPVWPSQEGVAEVGNLQSKQRMVHGACSYADFRLESLVRKARFVAAAQAIVNGTGSAQDVLRYLGTVAGDNPARGVGAGDQQGVEGPVYGPQRVMEVCAPVEDGPEAVLSSGLFLRVYLPLLALITCPIMLNSPLDHLRNTLLSVVNRHLDVTLLASGLARLLELQTISDGCADRLLAKEWAPTKWQEIALPITAYLKVLLTLFKRDTAGAKLDAVRACVTRLEVFADAHAVHQPFRPAQEAVRQLRRVLTHLEEQLQPAVVPLHKAPQAQEGPRDPNAAPGHWRPKGPRHDNDRADIQQIRVVPTEQELRCEEALNPYLPRNDGSAPPHLPANSAEALADMQFRLFRHDMCESLIKAMQHYDTVTQHAQGSSRATQQQLQDGLIKCEDVNIHLYSNVVVHFMRAEERGQCRVMFDVTFDPPLFIAKKTDPREFWEQSKRLQQGSLVCLAVRPLATGEHSPASLIFAIVAERKAESLAKRKCLLALSLLHGDEPGWRTMLALQGGGMKADVRLLQTGCTLFAYEPVLKALQQLHLPPLLEPLLATTVKPAIATPPSIPTPPYLQPVHDEDVTSGTLKNYDLSLLIDKEKRELAGETYAAQVAATVLAHAELDQEERVDNALRMLTTLDDTQIAALKASLQQCVALIQGPPGTGKTFLAIKIVQLLLHNTAVADGEGVSKPAIGPILVACYTNHALDQFLEGLLDAGITSIARVGGRSKSERLDKYSLYKLNMATARTRTSSILYGQRRAAVQRALEDLVEQEKLLQTIQHHGRLKWSQVQDIIQEQAELLYDSLLEGPPHTIQQLSAADCWDIWLHGRDYAPSRGKRQVSAPRHTSKPSKHAALEARRTRKRKLGTQQPSGYVDGAWQGKRKRKGLFDSPADIKVLNPFAALGHLADQEMAAEDAEVVDEELPDLVLKDGEVVHEGARAAARVGTGARMPSGRERDLHPATPRQTSLYAQSPRNTTHLEFDAQYGSSVGSGSTVASVNCVLAPSDDEEEQWTVQGKVPAPRRKEPATNRLLEELLDLLDIWHTSRKERQTLLRYWMQSVERDQLQAVMQANAALEQANARLEEVRQESNRQVLQNIRVIGMTTSKMADLQGLIKSLNSKVVVVEEAAEVLEAHVLACISPSTEHLILIGDHEQLRPKINSYQLQMVSRQGYNLDLSLFERLADPQRSNFPVSTLGLQHRMRHEISTIVRRLVYPNLKDHPCVLEYPTIRGMAKPLYFLSHQVPEGGADEDTATKFNTFEVQFVLGLTQHLIFQGYHPTDIAILTPYLGQLRQLKKALEQLHLNVLLDSRDADQLAEQEEEEEPNAVEHFTGYKSVTGGSIRATTIDNFQGEEAKIVLLSLVRSNKANNVGFVKLKNRVNVLLSRAKHGMYIVGNATCLTSARHSQAWQTVVDTLQQQDAIGPSLPLQCANHGQRMEVVSREDFMLKSPDGGCTQPCGQRLPCGHTCPRMCHIDDPQHKQLRCQEACTTLHTPCHHICDRLCGEPHKHEGVCRKKVTVQLDCGHEVEVHCMLAQKPERIRCSVKVSFTMQPCGHEVQCCCHEKAAWETDPTKCTGTCGAMLEQCSHACKEKCGQCASRTASALGMSAAELHQLQMAGTLPLAQWNHAPCKQICDRLLNCGHSCKAQCHVATTGRECPPCQRQCGTTCQHSTCGRSCSEMCSPCAMDCAWRCPHTGACVMPCGTPCSKLPCDRRCKAMLPCGHQCPLVCGEHCQPALCVVCCKGRRKIPKVMDLVMYEEKELCDFTTDELAQEPIVRLQCGCLFTMSSMDGHLELHKAYTKDSQGRWTNIQELAGLWTSKTCPTCMAPARGAARYGRVLNHLQLCKQNHTWQLAICLLSMCNSMYDAHCCHAAWQHLLHEQVDVNIASVRAGGVLSRGLSVVDIDRGTTTRPATLNAFNHVAVVSRGQQHFSRQLNSLRPKLDNAEQQGEVPAHLRQRVIALLRDLKSAALEVRNTPTFKAFSAAKVSLMGQFAEPPSAAVENALTQKLHALLGSTADHKPRCTLLLLLVEATMMDKHWLHPICWVPMLTSEPVKKARQAPLAHVTPYDNLVSGVFSCAGTAAPDTLLRSACAQSIAYPQNMLRWASMRSTCNAGVVEDAKTPSAVLIRRMEQGYKSCLQHIDEALSKSRAAHLRIIQGQALLASATLKLKWAMCLQAHRTELVAAVEQVPFHNWWPTVQRKQLDLVESAQEIAEAVFPVLHDGRSAGQSLDSDVSKQARELLAQLPNMAATFSKGNDEDIKAVLRAVLEAEPSLGRPGWYNNGHLFQCPNGHYYFIGECGGAMQESRCPDCGTTIGGGNHALRQGNRNADIRL